MRRYLVLALLLGLLAAPGWGQASRSFNGTSDVHDIAVPAWTENSAFTIAHWVWIDSTDSDNVLWRDTSAGSGGTFVLAITNFSFRLLGATASGCPADSTYENRWVHLAVVNDGDATNGRLYLDGAVACSVNPGASTMTSPLQIMKNGTSGNWAKGRFAHLMLWERALSAGEVATLYRGALVPAGALGYYTFMEASGATSDRQGNNDSTCTNCGTTSSDGPAVFVPGGGN